MIAKRTPPTPAIKGISDKEDPDQQVTDSREAGEIQHPARDAQVQTGACIKLLQHFAEVLFVANVHTATQQQFLKGIFGASGLLERFEPIADILGGATAVQHVAKNTVHNQQRGCKNKRIDGDQSVKHHSTLDGLNISEPSPRPCV